MYSQHLISCHYFVAGSGGNKFVVFNMATKRRFFSECPQIPRRQRDWQRRKRAKAD